MTDTIASSGLKSLGPDKTMNKGSGNLPKDRVYSSISKIFVDDIHIILSQFSSIFLFLDTVSLKFWASIFNPRLPTTIPSKILGEKS